eukprot:g27810.t1
MLVGLLDQPGTIFLKWAKYSGSQALHSKLGKFMERSLVGTCAVQVVERRIHQLFTNKLEIDTLQIVQTLQYYKFTSTTDNSMTDKKQKAPAPTVVKALFAGSLAGMASIVAVHPFDTVRTRLQTSSQYKGAIDCVLSTAKNEGVFALYKGLSMPFAFQAVYKAVMFGSFQQAKNVLHDGNSGQPPTKTVVALCGAYAGGVNSFVVTPVELIRNRLMVEYSKTTSGPLTMIKDIVNANGVTGMFKGLGPTLARDVPGVGAWFFANEATLRYFRQQNGTEDVGTGRILFAGALGGFSFWLWALPMDTVKSIIQTDTKGEHSSMVSTIINTYKRDGLGRFFRGWSVAYTRGMPASAITFYVYAKAITLADALHL